MALRVRLGFGMALIEPSRLRNPHTYQHINSLPLVLLCTRTERPHKLTVETIHHWQAWGTVYSYRFSREVTKSLHQPSKGLKRSLNTED
jgi:hypothetical protein